MMVIIANIFADSKECPSTGYAWTGSDQTPLVTTKVVDNGPCEPPTILEKIKIKSDKDDHKCFT